MPPQTPWTASIPQLRATHRAAENLKTALDKEKDPEQIVNLILVVRRLTNKMVQDMSFVKQPRGGRIVVPNEQIFLALPGLIEDEVSRLAKRPKNTPETAALLKRMVKIGGDKVYNALKAAYRTLGVSEFRLR